jgi:hypothetical protein
MLVVKKAVHALHRGCPEIPEAIAQHALSIGATGEEVRSPASSATSVEEGDGEVQVVFVEPAHAIQAKDLDDRNAPIYQVVADPARVKMLKSWMDNESARMALDLYAQAWALTPRGRRAEPPVYYVALVPGGNHAAVGLRLLHGPELGVHAQTAFIQLAPEDWRFSTTLLHETGHVVLSMLNGGAEIPKKDIAAISHTTAALTDRGTAFDEGFAIHLETLAAHFTSDAFLKERYHHQRFRFGVPEKLGEFHRHAGDLLSFSQTIARYYEVRENNFAFSPAFTGPDYLRVQLEKARDFASLRDANQLLQSEGFYASFFFGMLMRGGSALEPKVVKERQQRLLVAMAEMLGSGARKPDDPFLLFFVEAYLSRFPGEASEVIDVLLDLSHGVFADRNAAALWREHYLGALHLYPAERDARKIEAARMRWRAEVARDPKSLYRNLGPQLRAEVAGPMVSLVAFGEPMPLSFDLNTVEEGVIRLIPGITNAEVGTLIRARAAKAFVDAGDFRRRSGFRKRTLARLIIEKPQLVRN